MKTYLVTGVTGTLGQIVTKKLLDQGHKVIGVSRDEFKQNNMFKHDYLKLYIADIKNKHDLDLITEHIDVIYHFAALKCIYRCGVNPWQAVQTNIIGTQNLLDFQRERYISKLIMTSTDKAFKPINQYGKTKAIAENLVATDPDNVICRYGNVFGSRGSVIHKWIDALKSNSPLQITDPNMTRFFMRQSEAMDFVLSCENKTGIQIPKMKSTDLWTLAKAVGAYMGYDLFAKEIVGNRGKEKIHEEMSDEYNSQLSERFTIAELILMIGEL